MLYFNESVSERVIITKAIGFGLVTVKNRKGEVYNTFLNLLSKIN
ncbi:hypothetical protein SAMN05660493_01518 [Epilithonimonas bovis DSM 19482]|uniref:Uncharacterized protein n=1 Tax=Epilithonimonas bovis DSM 19482 TaxID=1121284 RepID=A0A1U7PXW5_9FLAO|nr:hypothetical protein SAMN05660493_01518 [Epilithonimonas bovis DSM 19482]